MSALDCSPRVELSSAELRFLVRMPSDARGIENHLCAAERGEARTFGIPLVPTNLDADLSVLRVEIRESEVAWRKIKLFVVERIVGNMHLAIFAEEAAVGVDHRASVVIHTGGAALEKRSDDNDSFLFRLAQTLRSRDLESARRG